MKISVCQQEVIPGNPQENLKRMIANYSQSVVDGADVCIFSELVLPGYLLGDMWDRQSFLNECEYCGKEAIAATRNKKTVMVFGNVGLDREKTGEDGRILKFNAAFVAHNGSLIRNGGANPYDFLSKTLMPNYREFDDTRYFYDNRKLSIMNGVNIKDILMPFKMPDGTMLGVGNCEDFWDGDYSVKPAFYLCENGADILINISCSPYTHGKNDKRNRVFSSKAKAFRKPLVYVNCVGSQNNGKTIYTFDGNSCIYDHRGMQLNPFKPFQDAVQTFNIGMNEDFGNPKFEAIDDIGTIYDSIVYATKCFVKAQKIERVVIGASGGIDSSVVACIMAEVVGPKNLLLVNMPSKYNSDLTKDAARQLADNLDCNYVVTPIEDSVSLTKQQISPINWEITNEEWMTQQWPSGSNVLSTFMLENVQARDRSSRILAAWASWFKAAFTCNANKSEAAVGYTTLYGDAAGFIMPIGDLWKTQVYKLAYYINKTYGNLIPMESITVKPSAELSESQDVTRGLGDPIIYEYHDKLFASWIERWDRATPEENLEWYLNGTLEKEIGYNGNIKDLFPTSKSFILDLERWWNLYSGLSVAKRIQSPPIIGISRRAVASFDIRESQIPPYYSEKYLNMKKEIME